MSDLSRRRFINDTTCLAAGAALASQGTLGITSTWAVEAEGEFQSEWEQSPDRIWLGPAYWSNPLQDWRIAKGKLVCTNAAADRHVHLLTHAVDKTYGGITLRVVISRPDGAPLNKGKGTAGFRIGVRGPLQDYRNALIFGQGIDVGMTHAGELFIGRGDKWTRSEAFDASREQVELTLMVIGDDKRALLSLTAQDPKTGEKLQRLETEDTPAADISGGIALAVNIPGPRVNNPNQPRRANNPPLAGAGQFAFGGWRARGSLLKWHRDRAFGPIFFTQYTLHRGVLKLTAQLPPLGEAYDAPVQLKVQRDNDWQTIATEKIDPHACTATFRIENWDDTRDIPYRVTYDLKGSRSFEWEGVVRKDPVDKRVITVADISCNAHYAFPNVEALARVKQLDPDVLTFTGDQYYESSGGYGVVRNPPDVAIVDMLRKWYLHGWTWRELMRDRPSISIPDDHDVYHGNIWGEGGEPVKPGSTIEAGGYTMSPLFVNAVHRTQTAHHPDLPDPAPGKQDISVYFGPFTYGRISFAILADRQFKTAPAGNVPPTGGRADHVKDPNFDPKTVDDPQFHLLGERQMKFLRDWALDWYGADMKAAISQTIFTAMATTHGGNREILVADYDANGWPQTARDNALRELRRAFAAHLAGDQHLPAVVHYGIDAHRDGPVAFASPAVNNLYPRWFEPKQSGVNRAEGAPENTGDFLDSFGNRMTVLACANPKQMFRGGILEKEVDKSAGFGVVRFDKEQRTITIECWPLLADPTQPGTQFPGWPVKVQQLDCYGRKAAAQLPMLKILGSERPVIHVIDEATGEVVYALRAPAKQWQPPVFAPGKYTLRVSEPESEKQKEVTGVAAVANNIATLEIEL